MSAYLKIGALVGAISVGWWLGSSMKQAQWDRAENKAVKAQIRLTQEAIDERDTLSAVVRKAALALSEAEDDAVRLADELQTEINKGPVIQTVEIKVPANGPTVSCAIPDARVHYRLFNCGINNSCQAVLPPRIPEPGSLPRP